MQHIERSTNRAWLGEFLRGRRERLSPIDYGFPVMQRRRSPGLRRDEVAQLSGISIAYYTWIEQGRDINMSADVLNAIARALGLNEAERVHLFTLVGIDVSGGCVRDDCLHPTIAHVLGHASPAFALLYDPWFNMLEATRLATAALGIVAGRELESNLLYRLFADPVQRGVWVDWESEARMAVGMFRQALARQTSASDGFALLTELLKMPDFERKWGAYDVRVHPSPDEFFRKEPCHLRHPDAGVLCVYRLAMAIPGRNDRTLVMCSPADSETSRKFCGLLEHAEPRTERYLRPA
jgi:MmyB-like transcription regulator ligand binding domain/Helix-turn-helix domain